MKKGTFRDFIKVFDATKHLFSNLTLGGLVFGIVNIVGNFGTVFCDQAYWQSSVAAKPLQVNFTGCPIIFAK